jgi:hypothetical protein
LRFDDTSSPSAQFINRPKEACQLGAGIDCSIRDLALTIAKVVGFKGEVKFDATKPDGTMRKLMNIDRLTSLGWSSTISMEDGLIFTYQWFLNNQGNVRVIAVMRSPWKTFSWGAKHFPLCSSDNCVMDLAFCINILV